MLTLRVEAPYASFRKSYARSFAETYPLPPPATVYGMLLSLVGEHFRRRHEGVRLAFAYKCRREQEGRCGVPCLPRVATTLRKLSRYKYGVANKQSTLGNAPDFIETLCGIEFLCRVDSTEERSGQEEQPLSPTLEERIVEAVETPGGIQRSGVLCLGLSDDAVNEVSLYQRSVGVWHRLQPSDTGGIELPVWVDHVGAANTRWHRYRLETEAIELDDEHGPDDWAWTEILNPCRPRR